jgi:hypothetical protein
MFLAPDDPMFDATYGAIIEADPDTWPCARCGQEAIMDESTDCAEAHVCESCRAKDCERQGEAMRLFAPAPNQIPGQMSL